MNDSSLCIANPPEGHSDGTQLARGASLFLHKPVMTPAIALLMWTFQTSLSTFDNMQTCLMETMVPVSSLKRQLSFPFFLSSLQSSHPSILSSTALQDWSKERHLLPALSHALSPWHLYLLSLSWSLSSISFALTFIFYVFSSLLPILLLFSIGPASSMITDYRLVLLWQQQAWPEEGGQPLISLTLLFSESLSTPHSPFLLPIPLR